MPRTKGAKNKPKSDNELIEILKKRGYKVIEGAENVKNAIQNAAGENYPPTDPVIHTPPKKENENPEIQPKSKKSFEIKQPPKQPENTPPVNPNAGILRCGNPACGKILQTEISECPFCGCRLSWS